MKYLVYTPEYGTVVPILDDGSGPTEYGADVLYVRATSRQRAKILAVRAWSRRPYGRDARWVHDARSDGRNPFAGLKVEPAEYSWRDDAPDDAEPEDVCRGCGAPNVSHMRTPSDDYCPECRFADREDQ